MPNKDFAYRRLYTALRREIEKGGYAFGEKLPSKRALADRHRLSVVTVEHALALLTEEGYLAPRERSGHFVVYREGSNFPVADPALRPLPPETLPAKPSFPFSVYVRAMRRVMGDFGAAVLVKSPNNGLPALRTALARYLLRSREIEVSPDQIVVGAGAEYLYGLIVQLFGRRMRYAIETPSYEKIEQVYRAGGVSPEKLPLGPEGIDSGALAASAARLLHITPYRSFPSGVTASAAKKREYLRVMAEREGWIVEDDVESEFTPFQKPVESVFSLDPAGRVLYLNTFSRTITPAVRIAYLVLPLSLLGRFEEKAGFYSCTVPTFEQYVLAELLESGDFERHINRVRREMRKKRSF